jgi:hypothetical protein
VTGSGSRCRAGRPAAAEQPLHLTDGLAAGALDREQRLALAGLLVRQTHADRSGLNAHDADRVPDDVVQLARDASPLGGQRRRDPLVPLAFEHVRLELQHPERAADEQARRGQHDRQREVRAEGLTQQQLGRHAGHGERRSGPESPALAARPDRVDRQHPAHDRQDRLANAKASSIQGCGRSIMRRTGAP